MEIISDYLDGPSVIIRILVTGGRRVRERGDVMTEVGSESHREIGRWRVGPPVKKWENL